MSPNSKRIAAIHKCELLGHVIACSVREGRSAVRGASVTGATCGSESKVQLRLWPP